MAEDNGWSRFDSSCIGTFTIARTIISRGAKDYWIAQANAIFSQLDIRHDYEDYYFVNSVSYLCEFGLTTEGIPHGYLFLCPLHDLSTRTDHTLHLRYPDNVGFWSLDPLGFTRLSDQEAANLGLPSFKLRLRVVGHSWKSTSYSAIFQFHQGKGFSPNSPDVAQYLEYPLYQATFEQGANLKDYDVELAL
ncbi:hypothetical protein C8R44DRAFT_365253 [Mycena epipterygia]|nr:hypothetical protein C8R44DRAFT_365253 [Mycena epipterygia]